MLYGPSPISYNCAAISGITLQERSFLNFINTLPSLHNISYANLPNPIWWAGALALLAVSFIRIAGVAGASSAFAQSAAPGPANVAAVAADPARDAAMKTYLQKHFKIASPDLIKFGPAVQTSIPGLRGRQMTVSNVEGQSVDTALFFDKSGTKMIIGSFMDTNVEPWGRVNLGGIHLNDNPTMGPADAPVTVVEFADFECPFCARAFSVLETMANTTYKDKMKVIFKNYPLNVHL